jgi:hypothetical protein
MGVILEEQIGFGGSDESTSSPRKDETINLDPIIRELKNKKSLIKEVVEISPEGGTDAIAKSYAEHINTRLASKLLKMAKGERVGLTKEEELFLKVQASKDTDEVLVEAPQIPREFTIKKGGKSLKINTDVLDILNKRDSVAANPTPYNSSNVPSISIPAEDLQNIIDSKEDRFSSLCSNNIQTVNKNAYEIRRDILEMALTWVNNNRETSVVGQLVPSSEDEVLRVAKKFYSFVENRR